MAEPLGTPGPGYCKSITVLPPPSNWLGAVFCDGETAQHLLMVEHHSCICRLLKLALGAKEPADGTVSRTVNQATEASLNAVSVYI